MDNTREKLIDVLRMAHDAYYSKFDASKTYADVMADHLIAEGVTFATDNKWIPVSERLPEKFGEYIVTVQEETGEKYSDYADYDLSHQRWRTGLFLGVRDKVTHWMPMPEPPKGDE